MRPAAVWGGLLTRGCTVAVAAWLLGCTQKIDGYAATTAVLEGQAAEQDTVIQAGNAHIEQLELAVQERDALIAHLRTSPAASAFPTPLAAHARPAFAMAPSPLRTPAPLVAAAPASSVGAGVAASAAAAQLVQ